LVRQEATMGSVSQRVIQHDFGFPRFVDAADAEVSALYSLCIVVSAAKRRARADAGLSRARDDVPGDRRFRDGWRGRYPRDDRAARGGEVAMMGTGRGDMIAPTIIIIRVSQLVTDKATQ